jgi:hypothetical protein
MGDDFLKGLGNVATSGLNFLSGGALFDALGNAVGLPPVITNAAKTVVGAVTGNVLLVADGGLGLAKELSQNQAAFTEYVAPKDSKLACEGYARLEERRGPAREMTQGSWGTPGSSAPGEVRPDGALDPSILQYRDALKTLNANFTLFDTSDGVKNGKFTRQTLEKVANDSQQPGSVREAARFLLAHPEYRAQLDTASQKGGFVDGTFSTKDVRAALSDVEERISKYGVRSGTTGGTRSPVCGTRPEESTRPRFPCEPGVRDIINDPSMSLEEKIEAMLLGMTEKMDGEILGLMDDLAEAQDRQSHIKNGKGDEKALADSQRDIDRIQLRLQKLVEKRKMMFEMMSTLSMKFHETAKTAISNMRGA